MEMYFDLSEYNKSKLETNEMFTISLYFWLVYIQKIEGGGGQRDTNLLKEGGQAYVNYM